MSDNISIPAANSAIANNTEPSPEFIEFARKLSIHRCFPFTVFVCAHNDDVLLDPPIFLDPGLSPATTSATLPATTSATTSATPPATTSATPPSTKARRSTNRTTRKPKPPPLYKNRHELCQGLGIADDDEIGMNDLRDWVETDCIRRGHPLTQQFSMWSDGEMKGLSKSVAARWNRENTSPHTMEWESIKALIHRICLDNVRNSNTRERRREARVCVHSRYI
jgi:hypothetical protein